MKRKNKGKGINSSTSQSHPNQPQCTVPVKPLAPYRFKRTPEIDRQLPVLLEYIQSVTKPEFIPKEIASASTILYAIQEGLVSRNGDVFEIESSLTLASLTDSGANWNPVTIFDARDKDVQDKAGRLHMVRLYPDGWKIGQHEGMDVWQAVRLLNELNASIV